MSQGEVQLDTTIQIVTPENIAFSYRVAGPFHRLPAYLIDLAIRLFLFIGTVLVLDFTLGSVGLVSASIGLAMLLWFFLEWFYGGLLEAVWNGQTPGKRLMRLRVVTVDGRPIRAWQAVLRNILRAVDALPMVFYQSGLVPLYLLGLLTSLLNDRYQRLGDLASGTMVVIEQTTRLQGVLRFREPRVLEMAARIPPNFTVGRSLALALSMYVQRRKLFSPARRQEIARHLGEPLRERLALPPNTDVDLLLCGLYQRTFLANPADDREVRA